MRISGAALAIAGALVASLPPAASAITFDGFKADGWCCTNSSRIGLDWSSDFGPDYQMTSDNTPGSIATSPGPVWDFGSVESGRSVEMALFRDLGGMSVSSYGLIEIGDAGPVGLGTVHRFQHHLTLHNPSNLYGLFSSAMLVGDFFFSGVTPGSPLFWGLEWDITVLNEGGGNPTAGALLTLDDIALSPNPFAPGPLGASRTISGSAFGSDTDGVFQVRSESSLDLNGDAELIWDLRIAFSGTSFDDIPLITASEPAGLGLLGATLALLRRLRRRTAPR